MALLEYYNSDVKCLLPKKSHFVRYDDMKFHLLLFKIPNKHLDVYQLRPLQSALISFYIVLIPNFYYLNIHFELKF